MGKKPSYQELETRVRELEEKAVALEHDARALRTSEEKYRLFVERGNEGIIFIQDGNIQYANPRAVEFMGFSLEEFRSKSFLDFIHPDDREMLVELYLAKIGGKEVPLGKEYRLIDKNGDTKWVHSRSSLVTWEEKPGLLTFLIDITERKLAEAALQQNERFLSDVFESIQDGLSILSRDLGVQRVNGVMQKWYAENLPLEGKKCFACYHNLKEPCDPCPTLRCLESGNTEHEIVAGLQGSPVEWLEVFSYPLKDRDTCQITGVVQFVRDITRTKRLEIQLQYAQKMEAIGTLAGGIAHNFNNILMGIQGYGSLMLLDAEPQTPNYDRLKNIDKLVRNGSKLTSQLLGFAREGNYEIKPLQLNEIVKETAETFRTTRKDISVHLNLDKALPGIKGDKGQIEQLLLNLFVNAADAMPEGGELYTTTKTVTHESIRDKPYVPKPGQYVLLIIRDTGVGMDADTIERVFDPFFTTKGLARGTGLGLASAYGIVKAHGGYIDVESEKRRGSTFCIYIPAFKGGSKKVRRQKDADNGSKTILLVDDEELILDVGVQLLNALGYRVLEAKNGKEALETYTAQKGEIDMVILDMIMPDLSGSMTYDRLKALNPEIKVLLSSGYSIDGQAQEILDRGCDGFIQKPFDINELGQRVKEIIED